MKEEELALVGAESKRRNSEFMPRRSTLKSRQKVTLCLLFPPCQALLLAARESAYRTLTLSLGNLPLYLVLLLVE